MRKNYTQKEIEEIIRAFDGIHGQGLISKIVFSEHEKEKILDPAPEKLAEFFLAINCNGVAKLIQTMNFPGETTPYEFGSHCIDFYGVTDGPFSLSNAATLVGVTIGSRKKNIPPLWWLSYLSKGFESLSELQRMGFNDVCEDFANLNEALISGIGVRKVASIEDLDF